MNLSYLGIAQLLIGLLFPLALLTGTMIMGKGGRSRSWWCMLFGASLAGAGHMGLVFPYFTPLFGWDGGRKLLFDSGLYPTVVHSAFTAGTLLFSCGFVLHALKVVRLSQRAEELERLTQAMAMATQVQQQPVSVSIEAGSIK